MAIVELNSKKRTELLEVPSSTKRIELKVSREKCNDVLLEVIDTAGRAKGKPLNKHLPLIQAKGKISSLRFMMNDFSTKPISVEIDFK